MAGHGLVEEATQGAGGRGMVKYSSMTMVCNMLVTYVLVVMSSPRGRCWCGGYHGYRGVVAGERALVGQPWGVGQHGSLQMSVW